MGILAEKLGISKTAIYHHVDSKEQLFELALDIALGSLETVLTRIENSHGGPQEKLEYAIRGSIQVVCYKLQFVTLLLRVRGNTDIEHGRVATTSTARSPQ
ncbi:TetR/AcrR family transcriptional regulator [Arthrobacter sp. 2RAF6]|uniref:TetR/AcrR family transcriptional regulator n=1 Tax=Arthrobacter sp. 2RAF6 TaxID=3233002 RepID=UPI003F93766E